MNYVIFPLLLCCLFSFVVPGLMETENRLLEEYFTSLETSHYDKRVAPNQADALGKPLDVNVSMHILDIHYVNDYCMDFSAQFYFRQKWVDPRLQFNFNASQIVLRDVEKIWTPDLFFVNEKDGSQHKVIQPNMFCRIQPNGTVNYSVRLSEILSCSMDLRKFPLDTQICKVRVESYGFTRDQIDLHWAAAGFAVSAADNISSVNFDLIDVNPTTNYVTLSSGTYSYLEVELTLKRQIGFYVRRMYAPFVILVLLSWLSLWIRPEERYMRLALLLVILYLMITIATELNHNIPYTTYTKSSDVWIGFCEAFVFAAFLEFIVVCIVFNKHLKGNSSKSKSETAPSMDPEAKDKNPSTDSLKSPLTKIIYMIDARSGGKGRTSTKSYRIDRISRIIFPTMFVIFNLVYWSVYCSA